MSNLKNILVFTAHFHPERQILNDLILNSNDNYKFTIITSFPNYPSRNHFKDYKFYKDFYSKKFKNIKIIRLPVIYRKKNNLTFLFLNYLSYVISSILLLPYLAFKKFDSIFVYLVSPFSITIAPLILSIIKKVNLSIWVLDIWPETLENFEFIYKKKIISLIYYYSQIFYKKCNSILISSRKYSESNSLINFKDKIFYAPQWADKNEVSFNKKKMDNIFRILFSGNLGLAQNLDQILNSILLSRDNDKIQWIFVGDGSEKERFEKNIYKNNLDKVVTFTGYLTGQKLHKTFLEADCFILPLKSSITFSKVIPSKFLTYLSYGKPILTLADGEISNIVNKHKLGLTANSNDFVKLYKNILSLAMYSQDELNLIRINSNFLLNNEFNKKKIIELISDKAF